MLVNDMYSVVISVCELDDVVVLVRIAVAVGVLGDQIARP